MDGINRFEVAQLEQFALFLVPQNARLRRGGGGDGEAQRPEGWSGLDIMEIGGEECEDRK